MRMIMISACSTDVEKIINKEKVVLTKKFKLSPPFKVFLYCNKSKPFILTQNVWDYDWENTNEVDYANGKVVAEFIVNNIQEYECEFDKDNDTYQDIQIVYRDDEEYPEETTQFVITSNDVDDPNDCDLLKKSCLTFKDMRKYLNFEDKTFYAWDISELKVYDKPKELAEFKTKDRKAISRCEYRQRIFNDPDKTNGAWLPGGYVCLREDDWCQKCKLRSLTVAPKNYVNIEEI